MSRCRLDVTRHVSREGVVMSPAATWTVQTDTPPVPSLAAVLGQGVEILVIVHPKWVLDAKAALETAGHGQSVTKPHFSISSLLCCIREL